MSGDLRIREPQSVEEYRGGLRTIAAAWQVEFDDIVNRAAIGEIETLAEGKSVERRFRESAHSDRLAVRVALDAGEVVGTGSVSWDPTLTKAFVPQGDAEIRTLYVHPDRWGEGIGTRLLEDFDAITPDSAGRFVLETFRDNERGRRFYESRGFERDGESDFTVGGETYPTVVYAKRR